MAHDDSWDDLDLEARRAKRRKFRKEREKKLDRYRDRLDLLEMDDPDEEVQADLFAKVEDVRRTKQKLRGRLKDLHDATDSEWEGVREEFIDSWGEFEDDWEDLSNFVEGRIDHSEDES